MKVSIKYIILEILGITSSEYALRIHEDLDLLLTANSRVIFF